ncbi:helix-turn-helix domain-containing protein [Solibacillus sp. MA9]|uniref:Helix-turn-helix domain-containing protein n=2 Tax=Solibacillus palustris TaxID=2908203 RepID=A0ABS9UI40_9BACL|nr:helix-turn-helix domain-containing protein [Solibacillus sp. MA9]
MTIKKICAITKLSKSTLYRALDKRKIGDTYENRALIKNYIYFIEQTKSNS